MRTAPRHVWLITALYATLLVSWSILVPLYHAPDEPNHADAVMRLVEGRGWAKPGDASVSDRSVAVIAASPFGSVGNPLTLHDPVTGRPAPTSNARPPWQAMRPDRQAPPVLLIQQLVEHPPLFYAIDAAVLRILPGADGWGWDTNLAFLRVLSVLMTFPLPLLAWVAAYRLGANRAAATSAAVLIVAIPELAHIGSVINNDVLVTLSGGLVAVGVACVLRGDSSRGTAIRLGVLVGLARLTKSLPYVLVAWVVAAYGVVWLRQRADADRQPPAAGDSSANIVPRTSSSLTRRVRFTAADAVASRPVRMGVLFLAVTVVCGGWWEVVNLARYHTVQPGIPGFPIGQGVSFSTPEFFVNAVKAMVLRFFSGIGWFEVNLSMSLAWALAAGLALLLVAAVAHRGGRRLRVDLLLFVVPIALLLTSILFNAYLHWRSTSAIAGLSGRYLFAGVVAMAAACGCAALALPARLRRWLPLALFLIGVATQYKAIRLSLDKFWAYSADPAAAWHALVTWSAWPTALIAAVGLTTVLLAGCVLISLVREGVADRSREPAQAHG